MALLLWIAFLGFYGFFLSRHYDPNGVQYALVIESTGPRFDPHHLLYEWVGVGVFRLLSIFGWSGRVLTAMQLANVFAGASGLCFLFLLLRRATGQTCVSLIPVFGLAFSTGYLFYSTNAQVQILPIPFAILTLIGLLQYGKQVLLAQRLAWLGVLALLSTIATLLFQPYVFLLPIVAAGVLVDAANLPLRKRLFYAAVYSLLMISLVGCTYIFVGYLDVGVLSISDLWLWITHQAQLGMFAGGRLSDMVLSWYGLSKTVTIYPGLWGMVTSSPGITVRASSYLAGVGAFGKVLFGLFNLVIFGIVVLPVGYMVIHRDQIYKRYPRLVIALGVWLLLFGGFAVWYISTSVESWLAPLVAIWMIWGLTLANAREGGAWYPVWRWARRFSVAFVVLVLALNLPVLAITRSVQTNEDYAEAMMVEQITSPDDLIVTFGEGFPYIPYFAQRATFVIPYEYYTYNQSRDETYEALEELVQRKWATGERVFWVEDLGEVAWYEEWMYEVGFSHDDLERFDLHLILDEEGFRVSEILPRE
jgi:hypothetical protein